MMDTRARRRTGIRSGLAALAVLALTAAPAGARQDLGNLMREKLDRAQRLFEAVVLARFPAVAREAGALLRISEESTWTPTAAPAYLRYASQFQEAARDLGRAAAARDMEAVSTAYMTVTSTCVQCHRLLRESRLAGTVRDPFAADARLTVRPPSRTGDATSSGIRRDGALTRMTSAAPRRRT